MFIESLTDDSTVELENKIDVDAKDTTHSISSSTYSSINKIEYDDDTIPHT